MVAEAKKPGPKPKVTPEVQVNILKHLRCGVSLSDASAVEGIDRRTVQRAMRANRDFAAGVKESKRRGKIRQIRKVTRSKDWKAAAWYLERVYGEEFGRKERHEHTGANGGPIQSKLAVDLSELSLEEVRTLNALRSRVVAPPGRN